MRNALGHSFRIREAIVIAHDCPESVRRLQLAEHLCARLRGRGSLLRLTKIWNGHEIAGQQNEVGVQGIHHADCTT